MLDLEEKYAIFFTYCLWYIIRNIRIINRSKSDRIILIGKIPSLTLKTKYLSIRDKY